MSKSIKDLVETIENEINSVSPYASLNDVEDEVKELIDAVKHRQCKHCQMNTEASKTLDHDKYIRG